LKRYAETFHYSFVMGLERLLTMDHDEAVRLKATERYLLEELDADQREEFEEHLFDCQECAVDVRAGAMFVEQSKAALAETPVSAPKPEPNKSSAGRSNEGWFSWLRPVFAVPVMAVLLAVIGYQNFIQIPYQQQAANQMQALPHASINISTRGGSARQVMAHPGEDVVLLVSVPPDPTYSSYILELYNQAGRLQWSLTIPAASLDDFRTVKIPGAGLQQGTYKLAVSGINAAGQGSKLDSSTIELQIQK
jgi:hypothetical protein